MAQKRRLHASSMMQHDLVRVIRKLDTKRYSMKTLSHFTLILPPLPGVSYGVTSSAPGIVGVAGVSARKFVIASLTGTGSAQITIVCGGLAGTPFTISATIIVIP